MSRSHSINGLEWQRSPNATIERKRQSAALATRPHLPAYGHDNDVAIVIAPYHVPRLIAALQRLILRDDTREIQQAPPTAPISTKSAAERQRRYRERKRNGGTVTRNAVTQDPDMFAETNAEE